MATGKVHDEHIANILGKEFSLKRPEELKLIQDAVYVLMDATVKDKNGKRLNEALQRFKDWNIADINPDEIVAPESSASTHQYYAHMGWDYNYEVEGLAEQLNTKEWQIWNLKQKEEFKTHLYKSQVRFKLGKEILIKSIREIFPYFNIQKTEALARIFYYTHIYGDLRWNSRLDYLIDVPQFRNGFIGSLRDFASPKDKEKINKLISKIMQELPDGLKFTIPADGDNAPIEDWKHCLPLDRAMEAVFEYFSLYQVFKN